MTMCGPNEVYSGCGDDGCQRRCDRQEITGCTPTCGAPACICEYGYVRNIDGNCVPITSCRKFYICTY